MPERLLGETLGRYRVEALVGSGGFAWVYRAFDPELEIPVALKVLKPQFAGDTDFEARFRKEASTAARLRHPNIVKIFAVGKENGAVYFAMDYLPRGLADRLEAALVLPESTVLGAGTDVAKALAFAHREGVIHRDIKVDNILFDDHGNAVVADFGIARAVADQVRRTATNMVVGTPQYFSPEQARGHELDGRSDIYSLGVTLYRAATGRLPFDGEDWYSIARQHIEEPPPPPRTIVPTLSPEFEAVVLRALAKDPADRYPNADEMAEDLQSLRHRSMEITAARTIVIPSMSDARLRAGAATPAGATTPPAAPRPRRRLAIATAIVGAVAVVGVAGLVRARDRDVPPVTPVVPPPPQATALPSGDTTGRDSLVMDSASAARAAATTDSARRAMLAPTTRRSLAVIAPTTASLTVNGRSVGVSGRWSSDTLKPGAYRLVAQLAAAGTDCPTARVDTTVRLGANAARRRVALTPRGCGVLEMETTVPKNVAATYRLTPVAATGDTARSGPLQRRMSLVLPAGTWRVRYEAAGCSIFYDDRVISEGKRDRVVAKLMCGDG